MNKLQVLLFDSSKFNTNKPTSFPCSKIDTDIYTDEKILMIDVLEYPTKALQEQLIQRVKQKYQLA